MMYVLFQGMKYVSSFEDGETGQRQKRGTLLILIHVIEILAAYAVTCLPEVGCQSVCGFSFLWRYLHKRGLNFFSRILGGETAFHYFLHSVATLAIYVCLIFIRLPFHNYYTSFFTEKESP